MDNQYSKQDQSGWMFAIAIIVIVVIAFLAFYVASRRSGTNVIINPTVAPTANLTPTPAVSPSTSPGVTQIVVTATPTPSGGTPSASPTKSY